MAKPIFLVGLPANVLNEYADAIQARLDGSMPDYYIVTYISGNKNPTFRAIYEKNFDEMKFEELKKLVRNLMKQKLNETAPSSGLPKSQASKS